MWRICFCWILLLSGLESSLGCLKGALDCPPCNKTDLSCTTQILGKHSDINSCRVVYYEPKSEECNSMPFEPGDDSYPDIGEVSLQPYIVETHFGAVFTNITVLKISFSNIKWKKMKFRFESKSRNSIHCSEIVISNDVTVNDQSVLYYNCYWRATTHSNIESHYFKFEATDGVRVNGGNFIFEVPTHQMLTSKAYDWMPFVYIEKTPKQLILHISPPPKNLEVLEYRIKLMNKYDELIANYTIKGNDTKFLWDNGTIQHVYHDVIASSGSYYLTVTPVHGMCQMNIDKCKTVKTSVIPIKLNEPLEVCIASIAALVVGFLFVTFLIMYFIRKYCCDDYQNLDPKSPTILVIYESNNRIHAECVQSFVCYLRQQYHFDVRYDADIANTTDKNPHNWADDAFEAATHIIFIGSPKDDIDIPQNFNDLTTVNPQVNIDKLLLRHLDAHYAYGRKEKKIVNVSFYQMSEFPIETKRHKTYHVEEDWHQLHSLLTNHMLAKSYLARSEEGKIFIDALNKAKKHLGTE